MDLKNKFSISLGRIIDEFALEELYMPENGRDILIHNNDVNRPGLQIAGFFDYFDPTRIQIMGKVEFSYLENFKYEERKKMIENLLKENIPALVITRDIRLSEKFIEACREYNTPLLRTDMSTSAFMAGLIRVLNLYLAERITMHGVLVEVHGEGVLLLGESGIGKSETALELVKRGHRLVADDAVEVKKVSDKTLIASSPAIIRHFIEIRGIGIIDVKNIFGIGAVKNIENIDLIIHLEAWQDGKTYDRLGMSTDHTEILGIKIPSLVIPVRPGRNLAIITEVAAMNNRQKRMGYNAAEELNSRLMVNFEEAAEDLN